MVRKIMEGINMTFDNLIPLIIITLFLIGIISVGKIASKRVETSEDYMVAGRGAPLLLIVGTLFATFWGGGTIIGATGAAYTEGIFGVVEDPFAAGLALILLGIFFVGTLRKLKIKSIGELYSFRFGRTSGYFASALMIPTYLIWTAVQLLAIGKIVNVLFGINFMAGYLIAAIVVISFTYMGGLIAVVWTDAIQMIIIFVGLIAILVAGFNAADGIQNVMKHAPADFWNILPRHNSLMSWISYIAMWAGMALGNIPSPDIAQRAFMAKDVKTARKGMIIAGGLYWILGFIPIIISLIGITLVSNGTLDVTTISADSELLITYMAKELLGPVGLGVFVASLIAAILSSASTSLFATAVLFSNDICKPLMQKPTEDDSYSFDKKMLRTTKLFVMLVGMASAVIGLASTNIYDLTIFAFTLQFGVLFFPFIFALKSKMVNTYGIIAGMCGGLLVNLFGVITQGSVIPEPWEFFTLVPAITNLLLIVCVSYVTRHVNKSIPLEKLYIKQTSEIEGRTNNEITII